MTTGRARIPGVIVIAGVIVATSLTSGAGALELPKIGVPEMLGGGSKNAPPTPGATPDCPGVFIDNGAAMLRAPADADGANVRYQLSISSTARECVIEGDRLTIKIGVEGGAILGPQGAPGSYGANVQIVVRNVKDESIAASKNYRVTAAIPAGAGRADFRLLADPVIVPVVSAHAQDDYEIIVGFAQGAPDNVDRPARKKKKGRRRGA